MNYLKDKSAYLCGPIKNASDDGVGWREEITPFLNELGVTVLDPCKKISKNSEIGEQKANFTELILQENWDKLKESFWPIVRHDLRSVDQSDFIIFNYDTDVQTVGSIHELVVANFEKKIILLKYRKDQLSKFNPWLSIFVKSHMFFDEWYKMKDYLKNVNGGKIDSSYWVL